MGGWHLSSLSLPGLTRPRMARKFMGRNTSITIAALNDVELLIRTFAGNAIDQPVLA